MAPWLVLHCAQSRRPSLGSAEAGDPGTRTGGLPVGVRGLNHALQPAKGLGSPGLRSLAWLGCKVELWSPRGCPAPRPRV